MITSTRPSARILMLRDTGSKDAFRQKDCYERKAWFIPHHGVTDHMGDLENICVVWEN